MTRDDFDYAATYSEMEDEELLQVARDACDLVPAAKAALDTELGRRGLNANILPEKDCSGEARNPDAFYCPYCRREVQDPLTCNECSSIICRRCGTKLQAPEEREDVEDDQAAPWTAG